MTRQHTLYYFIFYSWFPALLEQESRVNAVSEQTINENRLNLIIQVVFVLSHRHTLRSSLETARRHIELPRFTLLNLHLNMNRNKKKNKNKNTNLIYVHQ